MLQNLLLGCLVFLPLTLSNKLHWYMYAAICILSLAIILQHRRHLYKGSKYIWLGLGLIAVVALLNVSPASSLVMLPIYALVMLACLQIRVRQGRKWLAYFIIVQAVASILFALLIHPGFGNGGILDPANYSLASAITLTAFLLCYRKWQWLLAPFVIIALFFTSSEEAVLWLVVLGFFVLVRRDWSRKLLPALGAVVVCCISFFGFHQPEYLYSLSANQLAEFRGTTIPYPEVDPGVADPTRGRASGYRLAINTINSIGHGMNLDWTTSDTIHDVPLRAMYDVGVVGLIGLLLAIAVWLRRTSWYIGAVICSMMIFDHFLWTQIGVWLWAMFGLGYRATNSYIFKV